MKRVFKIDEVVFYNEDHDGKMTEVELNPSKEEIEKTCFGLVWLDKRDPRYPARRLLHPVPSMAQ